MKTLEPVRGEQDSLETNPGRLRKTFLPKVKGRSRRHVFPGLGSSHLHVDELALKLGKEVPLCFSNGSGSTSIALAACSFVSNSTGQIPLGLQ